MYDTVYPQRVLYKQCNIGKCVSIIVKLILPSRKDVCECVIIAVSLHMAMANVVKLQFDYKYFLKKR